MKEENFSELEALRELKRRKTMKEYEDNFAKFSEEQIKIITKDSRQGFVNFKLNEAQTIINDALEEQRNETGKVRAIILKARQQGISTYCAGRVFWKTFFQPYTRSVVMAHDSTTSDALFDMSRNLIDNMDKELRPSLDKSNKKEIKFEHNDSGYRLYTAGSKEAGRGTTPTIAHLSEVAFWGYDKEILAGLFQGISQAEGTEVIMESTANGASGEFFRLYKAAERGESDYIAIFIPWYATSEYQRALPDGFTLTVDEEDYKAEYNLSDEQMYWRRLKISESGEDKLRQEYPANAEEAFLVSGASVFNPEKINAMIPKPAKTIREFVEDTVSFEESRRGSLEIWIPPDWNESYIIGADVALGVKQDYSAAIVMNTDGHICAVYRNNEIDPSSYGDALFYLGRYYNNALLAVESNSMGVATLARLKQMGYINMYYQTKAAKLSHEEGETPGFRMSHGSKPMVIGHLKRAIEEDDIWVPCKTVISEMQTYVSDEMGKTNALPGCYDDTIMALAITWEVRRTHLDKLTNTKIGFKHRMWSQSEENWL